MTGSDNSLCASGITLPSCSIFWPYAPVVTFCDLTHSHIKVNQRQPRDWYESKQICEFEGGQLVTIGRRKPLHDLLDWIDRHVSVEGRQYI